jgi:hypothetical protein
MSTNKRAADPHRLRWERLGRQGQSCRILRANGAEVHVQFEDGFTAVLSRRALVRRTQKVQPA